ncbi:HAD family hydrolase [Aphanothece hegewaldii CCALA 016]|uniref:HAD family hydrolase n=1 Tax=Aphanothece hegewaldii CCALA 016 TaxID=2107694 RepID=A0A2T1LSJ0_9CHRO|nr:HAD family hydrolase [Aphanothece hegewaldii]PSF32947.1 HAD family hydrolase [Aphanothece hegewaldii CCALA 016]
MQPLSIKNADLRQIRLIATDLDGTLTKKGKFSPKLLQTLEKLAKHDITVLIVTGRSVAWVDGIRTYLPIEGAIAENGGIYFPSSHDEPEILISIDNLVSHRQALRETFQELQNFFPHLEESFDNTFRITDWTFELQGLTLSDLQKINQFCQSKNWSFTYSTIQCHIKPLQQNKANSLLQVLKKHFSILSPYEVMTVGDSLNDEPLFNPELFPISVGVANISHYLSQLKHSPRYITNKPECDGFSELANLILSQKNL